MLLTGVDEHATLKTTNHIETQFKIAWEAFSDKSTRAQSFPIARALLNDPHLNIIRRIGCLNIMAWSDGWQLHYARFALALANDCFRRHSEFSDVEVDELANQRQTAHSVLELNKDGDDPLPHPLEL